MIKIVAIIFTTPDLVISKFSTFVKEHLIACVPNIEVAGYDWQSKHVVTARQLRAIEHPRLLKETSRVEVFLQIR